MFWTLWWTPYPVPSNTYSYFPFLATSLTTDGHVVVDLTAKGKKVIYETTPLTLVSMNGINLFWWSCANFLFRSWLYMFLKDIRIKAVSCYMYHLLTWLADSARHFSMYRGLVHKSSNLWTPVL